jgi:hypothetical protein
MIGRRLDGGFDADAPVLGSVGERGDVAEV